MSGELIACDGVTVRYGARTAVRDVSFRVRRGEVVALVGPSGCGKTSVLHCLNRLIDLVPGARVDGRVEVGGSDVRGRDVDVVSLRRRVGTIFQRPQPFPFSIAKNLELPLREHGVGSRAERARRAEAALREVGLLDELRTRLHESALALSGGQQQRLCLARALALEPDALLLDEPTVSLDPLSAAVVLDGLERLKGRVTMVLVTHQLEQARRLADEVVFLWNDGDGGRLVERAPTRQFFAAPREPLTAAWVAGTRD